MHTPHPATPHSTPGNPTPGNPTPWVPARTHGGVELRLPPLLLDVDRLLLQALQLVGLRHPGGMGGCKAAAGFTTLQQASYTGVVAAGGGRAQDS